MATRISPWTSDNEHHPPHHLARRLGTTSVEAMQKHLARIRPISSDTLSAASLNAASRFEVLLSIEPEQVLPRPPP
ncbi:hypothetical protein, partial [Xanthobacter autotrophicus]|uniref:hypothetical protein n=1 Tax=Xanthobacter autotrophicus TaxID=280 RepID=UPI0024A64AED